MEPYKLFLLTYCMFCLTLGTIIHVFMIDLKYMKERYRKQKAFNVLIWLVIVGVCINAPLWYFSYIEWNKL